MIPRNDGGFPGFGIAQCSCGKKQAETSHGPYAAVAAHTLLIQNWPDIPVETYGIRRIRLAGRD